MNLNKAPCFYFSSNDEGIILEVNDTLCKQLGYSREELSGKKLDTISTIATRIFYQTHFFPLLKMQGYANEIFITLQTKDKQSLPVLLNAERSQENGSITIRHIGILVDNRKKFEDELVAAKKAAEAALKENTALLQAKLELQKNMEQLDQHIILINNQNEELKQFNRVVTHDLQEPLRKLSVFSHLLMDKYKQEEKSDPVLKKLMQTSEQMRSILSGLQLYVWLTETDIKPIRIDLNKIVLIVRQKLEQEFPETSIEIETEDMPALQADWDQMQLLLYHLLSNALHFRKENEKAFVQITGTIIQQNRFSTIKDKYKYENFLKLQIKDHGIGFDPAYKNQAFELFKRLHPTSGRGLGLSLCKKIVDNHDGRINIDSKPGEGTSIVVLIPVESALTAMQE